MNQNRQRDHDQRHLHQLQGQWLRQAVFLVLTLAGMSTMWMAVFADVGASLLVVGNGLRLLRK